MRILRFFKDFKRLKIVRKSIWHSFIILRVSMKDLRELVHLSSDQEEKYLTTPQDTFIRNQGFYEYHVTSCLWNIYACKEMFGSYELGQPY